MVFQMIIENKYKGSLAYSLVVDKDGNLFAVVTDFIMDDEMSQSRVFDIDYVDEIDDSNLLKRDDVYDSIRKQNGKELHKKVISELEEQNLHLDIRLE